MDLPPAATSPPPAAPFPKPVDTTRVAAVIGGLAVTMVAGLLPYGSATGFFILGTAACVLLLRWAFPAMWLYSLWLAAIYALAFIGATVFALSASVRSPLVGPVPVFAALVGLLEFVSLYIGLSLFAEVKSIRDFRTRLSITRGDNPPEYARVGLWTLALMGFFLLSNLSALFFVAWVRDAPVLWAHAAVEGLMIALGVYIIYMPEAAFGELPREFRRAVKAEGPAFPFVGVGAAGLLAPMGTLAESEAHRRCPVCAGALDFEERLCPSCAVAARVGWCPKSEVHVIGCEHCGRPVVYGKVVCPHCRGELKEALLCRSCKVHAPLADWKRAAA